MATKLSPANAARIAKLGIKAKNEEEAREQMLEILEKNEITGFDNEEIEDLIAIVESCEPEVEEAPKKKTTKKVVEEDDDDDSDDDSDDEEEAPAPKKKPAKKVVEEEDDEEEEVPAPKKKAKKVVVEEEEEDDDEEEIPAPKKKPSKKVVEEEDEDEEEEEAPKKKATKKAEPATKKKAEKKPSTRGVKLNPKEDDDDKKVFTKAFKALFPTSDFIYAWVSTAGVTIKLKGDNSNKALVLLENATKREDGKVYMNVFFLALSKQKELLEEAGIDFEMSWNHVPFLKAVELEEVVELISQFEDEMKSVVKKTDKKLGENRKKMEENLKKPVAKSTKPAKKVVEEEEEEEDDEEEVVVPKKKAKK